MTFAEDIERAAQPEPVEVVVIGSWSWGGYNVDARDEQVAPARGKPLLWEEARPLLDYEYDTGWGAPDCHAIAAYTATLVLFVSQYDGSTSIEALPRNPTPHEPIMPGG